MRKKRLGNRRLAQFGSSSNHNSSSGLGITEERHEPKIHVQLLVAMKKRQPRIVRRKVHFRLLVTTHHYDIFYYSCGDLAR